MGEMQVPFFVMYARNSGEYSVPCSKTLYPMKNKMQKLKYLLRDGWGRKGRIILGRAFYFTFYSVSRRGFVLGVVLDVLLCTRTRSVFILIGEPNKITGILF